MLRKQSPRELSSQYGYSSLDIADLIALVLRFGTKKISVYELSNSIVPFLSSSLQDSETTYKFGEKISQHVPINITQKHSVLGLYELLLRQKLEKNCGVKLIKPTQVMEMFDSIRKKRQEFVYGVYLSPRNTVVHKELLSKGTTDSVSIDVRDVLYFGVKYRTRHFIVVHNHPSGDPTPSSEDIEQTKRISSAAQILSMVMLDHIIVGKEGYYSFKESTSML